MSFFEKKHNLYQCHKLGYHKNVWLKHFLILRDVGFQKRIYDFKKDKNNFPSINL